MSVFISGASSGIGAACAKAFAQAGFDLVLVARREERLKKMTDELARLAPAGQPIKIHAFALDVRSNDAVQSLMAAQRAAFESVDVVINNAGLARGRGPIQEGNPAEWDEMIDTNLKGLLYVTRAFLPQLIAKKSGHIINLGSVAGYWAYPGGNVYSATKFAVRALNEAIRMDIHGSGVRVTEIVPGMVETEFSEVRFRDKEKAKAVYEGFEPLRAEDIAETVLWCVQRPARVNIQEVVIYPTAQASVTQVDRRN